MTGKYGNLLKKAREKDSETENNNESVSSNTALQQAVNTEHAGDTEVVKEKEVSLTIKVPKSWRQHWVAECKREGKTLKEVVVEMLSEKYSKP
jgi:hypothetical protein